MKPLALRTEDDLVLRQYSTAEDDLIYFKVQNENRAHIAEFGNKIYESLNEVKDARIHPNGIIRMGIWKDNSLIGEVSIASKNREDAEMGIWLIKNETGHGYATSAMKTATAHAHSKYKRVFAEVDPNNVNSINLLRRVGYYEPQPGKIIKRDWGAALVFESAQ